MGVRRDRNWIGLALLLLASGGGVALGVDDLSLVVAPGSTTVAPGNVVTVRLDVANLSAAINGVQIRISYDTARMTLIDVAPTVSPAVWSEVSQTNVAGAVDWAAVITGGSTVANHTIANLTFTAITEGVTSVSFRVDADPLYTKLTRESDNGTILPTKTNSGNITLVCSDGLFCNGVETFNAGSCLAGTPPCNDGIACTVDTCDEPTDVCTYTPNNAACDNALFCDGAETCSATLGCQAGTPPCVDAVACTVDTCTEATDTCTFPPSDALCDNALFCDGAETCHATLGCQVGTPPCVDAVACTVDTCTEATDTCTFPPSNALCDNALFCDGAETCHATLGCQLGTPPCVDAVACTVDTCTEATDTCTFPPNHAACDNGLFCDGAETCNVTLGCQAGAPPCVDGVACTTDTCTEATDTCTFPLNHAFCDNGLFCDGVEACDPVLNCVDQANPCLVTQFCNETTDVCDQCTLNSHCDDGNACTNDICTTGVCSNPNNYVLATHCCNPADGVTTLIDDSNACTTDSCNPLTGVVTNAHNGQITVIVQAQALSSAVTRDVTFAITDCPGSVDTRTVPVAFNASGQGSTVLTGVNAASDWLSVSEGHTLRRLTPLSFAACASVAAVSGASQLLAGDFNAGSVVQDNLVDVVDFSILASRWNQAISAGSSSGADATGDGLQNTSDFTAIQVNYFRVGEAANGCPALFQSPGLAGREQQAVVFGEAPTAVTRIPVAQLGIANARRADVNGDGIVDSADIEAFARKNGLRLLPEFEEMLSKTGRTGTLRGGQR